MAAFLLYRAITRYFSTWANICPQVSLGTASAATMGIWANTCSPARTVRVPRRWPLLTGAVMLGSSSNVELTEFFWDLSISS